MYMQVKGTDPEPDPNIKMHGSGSPKLYYCVNLKH